VRELFLSKRSPPLVGTPFLEGNKFDWVHNLQKIQNDGLDSGGFTWRRSGCVRELLFFGSGSLEVVFGFWLGLSFSSGRYSDSPGELFAEVSSKVEIGGPFLSFFPGVLCFPDFFPFLTGPGVLAYSLPQPVGKTFYSAGTLRVPARQGLVRGHLESAFFFRCASDNSGRGYLFQP